MASFAPVENYGRGHKPDLLTVVYDENRIEPREDRKYRGMDMLDEYEDNIKTRELDYDYDKREQEPLWSRYFAKTMFLTQISLIVGAFIMFAGAFTAEKNGFEYALKSQVTFGQMDDDVLYIPYGCAALSIVTAFVGCVGIYCRHRYILTTYVITLGLTLGLAIGGCLQASADYWNVYYYAKRQWWDMTYQQEQLYQHDFLCCNFDNVDPCCRWAVGEGACENSYMCFDRIKPHLEEQFKLISYTSAIQALICGFSFCLALGLVLVLQVRKCCDGSYDGDIPLKSLKESLTNLTSKGNAVKTSRSTVGSTSVQAERTPVAGSEMEMEDMGY